MGRSFRRAVIFSATFVSLCVFARLAFFGRPQVLSIASSSRQADTYEEVPGQPSLNVILQTINLERMRRGLQPLTPSVQLTAVAETRAADMKNRRYYAHKDPEGQYYSDLLNQMRITTNYSCENLDLQFTQDEHVYVNDWLSSQSGHRECLLDPGVNESGYAVVSLDAATVHGSVDQAFIVVAIHAATNRQTNNE